MRLFLYAVVFSDTKHRPYKMNDLYQGLKDEVEFWRGLISELNFQPDSFEYQRAEQALKFAQMKLDSLRLELGDVLIN